VALFSQKCVLKQKKQKIKKKTARAKQKKEADSTLKLKQPLYIFRN